MIYKPMLRKSKMKCELCGEEYDGILNGAKSSKYCREHRKTKYRKKIDKNKIKVVPDVPVEKKEVISSNQIIKHSYKHPIVVIGECQLEGCHANFDLLIIPNTYIYPKYCQEHRNQFKRERFLTNGKTNIPII